MPRAINEATLSRLPARIGRYEIVGHLAAGGMAEILLARVAGESGFARAVVVKRVLDHLARLPEFEAMFLDEARLVSGIHHPNVVQVFDLGRDGDELYLVMEYLEGESAAGLMRRLATLGEKLDPTLAAQIVAEICAGLHAAHELTDANGSPSNLVHRDVNPNNVFVGYDGSVKLIDFGVAKAADQSSRTEAGQIKGKYAYMSPEQCRGKPIDRRSDVFALGITLYELASGCRLFARPSEMLIFRAICRDRLPSLTETRTDAPEALANICDKALQRERERRYATAAEMRRDLSKLLASATDDDGPHERLASLMRRVFADRIEEKAELMRCVRTGAALGSIPPAESDLGMQLPTAVTDFGSETTDGGTRAGPRRSRRGLFVLLPAVVILGAGALYVRQQNRPPDPASAANPPVVAPTPIPAQPPAPSASAASSNVDASPPSSTPANVGRVRAPTRAQPKPSSAPSAKGYYRF